VNSFQGADPARLGLRVDFGNPVGKIMNARAGSMILVSKLEKWGQLFALEMERNQRSLSTRITKLAGEVQGSPDC